MLIDPPETTRKNFNVVMPAFIGHFNYNIDAYLKEKLSKIPQPKTKKELFELIEGFLDSEVRTSLFSEFENKLYAAKPGELIVRAAKIRHKASIKPTLDLMYGCIVEFSRWRKDFEKTLSLHSGARMCVLVHMLEDLNQLIISLEKEVENPDIRTNEDAKNATLLRLKNVDGETIKHLVSEFKGHWLAVTDEKIIEKASIFYWKNSSQSEFNDPKPVSQENLQYYKRKRMEYHWSFKKSKDFYAGIMEEVFKRLCLLEYKSTEDEDDDTPTPQKSNENTEGKLRQEELRVKYKAETNKVMFYGKSLLTPIYTMPLVKYSFSETVFSNWWESNEEKFSLASHDVKNVVNSLSALNKRIIKRLEKYVEYKGEPFCKVHSRDQANSTLIKWQNHTRT